MSSDGAGRGWWHDVRRKRAANLTNYYPSWMYAHALNAASHGDRRLHSSRHCLTVHEWAKIPLIYLFKGFSVLTSANGHTGGRRNILHLPYFSNWTKFQIQSICQVASNVGDWHSWHCCDGWHERSTKGSVEGDPKKERNYVMLCPLCLPVLVSITEVATLA